VSAAEANQSDQSCSVSALPGASVFGNAAPAVKLPPIAGVSGSSVPHAAGGSDQRVAALSQSGHVDTSTIEQTELTGRIRIRNFL
jgi:hypothetical protein